MDIRKTATTPNSLSEQKNSHTTSSLSRELNLVIGKTVAASVLSTATITPAERAELLIKNTRELHQAELTKPMTPKVMSDIDRLKEQQRLIQSPTLKWVVIMLNNRQITLYSDKPVTPGEQIHIQLQTAQKLIATNINLPLNNTPQQEGESTPPSSKIPLSLPLATSPAINPSKALSDLINDIANNKTVNDNKEQSLLTKNQTPLNSATEKKISIYLQQDLKSSLPLTSTSNESKQNTNITALQMALRNLLPQQDKEDFLFTAIIKLQSLPIEKLQQLSSESVAQSLKNIAAMIRSPLQLNTGSGIEKAFKNSGIFFENQLNSLFKNITLIKDTETETPKTIGNKNQQELETEGTQTDDSKTSPLYKQAIDKLTTSDLKGALLKLLHKTTAELNGNLPINTSLLTTLLKQLNLPKDGANDLKEFLKTLQKPTQQPTKENRIQILELLQKHCLHSLAKIQLNQLQSKIQDTESLHSDIQNWQLDIPIKLPQQEQIQPIHIQIEKEESRGAQQSSSEAQAKEKKWNITLNFDLPTRGNFCAQLSVINSQVGATLWAAQQGTVDMIQSQLKGLRSQLESEGVTVTQLQCNHGHPPKKKLNLSYSLIDTKT